MAPRFLVAFQRNGSDNIVLPQGFCNQLGIGQEQSLAFFQDDAGRILCQVVDTVYAQQAADSDHAHPDRRLQDVSHVYEYREG